MGDQITNRITKFLKEKNFNLSKSELPDVISRIYNKVNELNMPQDVISYDYVMESHENELVAPGDDYVCESQTFEFFDGMAGRATDINGDPYLGQPLLSNKVN